MDRLQNFMNANLESEETQNDMKKLAKVQVCCPSTINHGDLKLTCYLDISAEDNFEDKNLYRNCGRIIFQTAKMNPKFIVEFPSQKFSSILQNFRAANFTETSFIISVSMNETVINSFNKNGKQTFPTLTMIPGFREN